MSTLLSKFFAKNLFATILFLSGILNKNTDQKESECERIEFEDKSGIDEGPSVISSTVKATITDNDLCITFTKPIAWASVIVKDTDNEIIYNESYTLPESVNVSMLGYESGYYTLELRSSKRHLYGSFIVIN